jgi:hypothetical protein
MEQSNEISINQQSFVIVPEWVLMLPIKATSLRVYCVIRKHADSRTGKCFPSRRLIASKAFCSVSAVDRAIKELVEHRALTVAKRKSNNGDWSSNLYTVRAQPTGSTQAFAQVAPIYALPTIVDDLTGGVTDDARTITKPNHKHELSEYTPFEENEHSQPEDGASTVQGTAGTEETAQGSTSNVRTVVVDEFLRRMKSRSTNL